jgi:hypothetical protein
VQPNALPVQPSTEAVEDALGEQHAAGRREQGKAGALEAKKRQARAERLRRPDLDRQRHVAKRALRGAHPAVLIAGHDQRAGRMEVALAEVGPEPVPRGVRVLHHARIAGHGAVGGADQPMLVKGRGKGIGDRSLLVQDRLVPRPAERPGGAQTHDSAADDDHSHALTSRVRRNRSAPFALTG